MKRADIKREAAESETVSKSISGTVTCKEEVQSVRSMEEVNQLQAVRSVQEVRVEDRGSVTCCKIDEIGCNKKQY